MTRSREPRQAAKARLSPYLQSSDRNRSAECDREKERAGSRQTEPASADTRSRRGANKKGSHRGEGLIRQCDPERGGGNVTEGPSVTNTKKSGIAGRPADSAAIPPPQSNLILSASCCAATIQHSAGVWSRMRPIVPAPAAPVPACPESGA